MLVVDAMKKTFAKKIIVGSRVVSSGLALVTRSMVGVLSAVPSVANINATKNRFPIDESEQNGNEDTGLKIYTRPFRVEFRSVKIDDFDDDVDTSP